MVPLLVGAVVALVKISAAERLTILLHEFSELVHRESRGGILTDHDIRFKVYAEKHFYSRKIPATPSDHVIETAWKIWKRK